MYMTFKQLILLYLPVYLNVGLQGQDTEPGFTEFRDVNTGSHTCRASVLLTEPNTIFQY